MLSDGYKHGSIKKVEYNGYPTVADWTFERNHNGVRVKVLNRGFKVDAKRGYSIMIVLQGGRVGGRRVPDAARNGVRHVHAHGLTARHSGD